MLWDEICREGEAAFMRHYYLYAKLAKDTLPEYQQLRDSGEVIIFRKNERS